MMAGADGKKRCFGNQPSQTLYAAYHDNEWGIPVHDDQKLLEMLILEGAQAGLSWETILKKREGYWQAFHHFVPEKVAAMSDGELEALRDNPSVIRNRLKIFSARKNAKIFLEIQKKYGSFAQYLWFFVGGKTQINHWKTKEEVPVQTTLSQALSLDLKKRGMTFVGPTIMYSYMQAVGIVNDHLQDCWCYQPVVEKDF
jgi:DNA-3-methyladenine glycosylase I